MSQRGFAPIVILIIMLLSAGIVGGSLYVKNNLNSNNAGQNSEPSASQNPSQSSNTPDQAAINSPSINSQKENKSVYQLLLERFKNSTAPIPTTTSVKINLPSPTPQSVLSPTLKPPTPTSILSTPTITPKITCIINYNFKSGSTYTFLAGARFDNVSSMNWSGVQWDFDGDGNWDTNYDLINQIKDYTYTKSGTFTVRMHLKGETGLESDVCTNSVTVQAPVTCEVHSDVVSGSAPLTVNFYYGATYSYNNGYVTNVQWDFDGDGNWDTLFDVASQRPSHLYSVRGNYNVKMHLQTSDGTTSDICTGNITVN